LNKFASECWSFQIQTVFQAHIVQNCYHLSFMKRELSETVCIKELNRSISAAIDCRSNPNEATVP
jgi:hypothetical protein